MFENVLVGVGDSQGGADALALARQLISPRGEMTLAKVQVVARKPSADSGLQREGLERVRDLAMLTALRDEANVDGQVQSVKDLSVARGLRALARAEHADLLVVGASRTGGLDRMLSGDDTQEILRGSPCPVAVAPVGYASRALPIEEIGVAYDGSEDGERAVTLARAIAADSQARLSALQVVPTSVEARDPWNPDAAAAAAVAAAEQRILTLGGMEPRVSVGEPVDELVRLQSLVDLLVLAAHRHPAVERFVRLSISETLAEQSAVPLLVLPPAHSV
jgi:nucleotide-binding universal stress UspA family protein